MRRCCAWLFALLVLAGCASPTEGASPSGPVFDGTYSVRYADDAATTDTWMVRSSCDDGRCVATLSIVDPNRTDGVPFQTRVFDHVDGRWVAVGVDPGTCTPHATGQSLDTEVWTVIALAPGDGGTLDGTYDEASAVGACTGQRRLVLTRVAEVNPKIALADPAALPPRTDSPAMRLHGTYAYTQTHAASGTTFPTVRYRGDTHCLRTGDRCQTVLRSPADDVLALDFAHDHWTAATPPLPADCAGMATARYVTESTYPLPTPTPDPIPELTGTAHQVVTGGCDASFDLAVKLVRTGD